MFKSIWFLVLVGILIGGCGSGDAPKPKAQEGVVNLDDNKTSDLTAENRLLKEELKKLTEGKRVVFESMFAAMVANNEELVLKKSVEIEKNYPETKEALIAHKFKLRIINKYKNKLDNSMSLMKKKDNKSLKTVWYYDEKTQGKMSTSPIFVYISKRYDDKAVLRMRLQTTTESINGTNGFVLFSDRSSYDIIPPIEDIKKKQIQGGLWSWYDKELNIKEIDMLKDIVYAKKPSIRFLKSRKYEQLPISFSDRKAIIRILRAYYNMNKVAKLDKYL
jgi:hypothetical protein